MKSFILALVFFPLLSHARWFGEPVDRSTLLVTAPFPPLKESTPDASLAKFMRVFSSRHANESVVVKSSRETGRIFEVTLQNCFEDVQTAIAFVSWLCEGSAKVPTEAVDGRLIVDCKAGGPLKGVDFKVELSADSIGLLVSPPFKPQRWTLSMRCDEFATRWPKTNAAALIDERAAKTGNP